MCKKVLDAFVIALLACVVLGFGFAVWSANQQQTNNRPDQASKPKPSEIALAESADDRIARYNFWLTIMTGVLAFSTIGLWIETNRAGVHGCPV